MKNVNNFKKEEILLVFGQNIKKAREFKKMRICQLALLANYDRIRLAKIEQGTQNIKLNTAVKLAKALDVPLAVLFSRNFMSLSEDGGLWIDAGYLEDEHLLVFIENFKRGIIEARRPQMSVYMETGMSESLVSRIMKGDNTNPTIITLSALAYAAKKDLSVLFVRNS